MISDKVHLLFRSRIRIHNLKLWIRIRIRILQKVSDLYGSGFGSGSTTLVGTGTYLWCLIMLIVCRRGCSRVCAPSVHSCASWRPSFAKVPHPGTYKNLTALCLKNIRYVIQEGSHEVSVSALRPGSQRSGNSWRECQGIPIMKWEHWKFFFLKG
jgi:hypothetical protein